MSGLRFVLASASPRRRELLAALGLDPEVRPAGVDESMVEGESPFAYVERLAREKAETVAAEGPELVLGADTVVVLDGEVLGKPRGPNEARAMLRRLSGREHRVLSGAALHETLRRRTIAAVDATTVVFRDLEEEEIEAYVASGEPLDKAGAYGIQGRAAVFVPRIAGSYSNVVGLPLATVDRLLREMGYRWEDFRA